MQITMESLLEDKIRQLRVRNQDLLIKLNGNEAEISRKNDAISEWREFLEQLRDILNVQENEDILATAGMLMERLKAHNNKSRFDFK